MNEVQLKTKIEILQARERQLQKKFETSMHVRQNCEESLHTVQVQHDALEKQWDDMTVTNYEMKEQIIYL